MARRLPKSMTGVFRDLTSNRKARSAASASHTVRGVTKSGALSKMPTQAGDHHKKLSSAAGAAKRLEGLNPGRTFVVTSKQRPNVARRVGITDAGQSKAAAVEKGFKPKSQSASRVGFTRASAAPGSTGANMSKGTGGSSAPAKKKRLSAAEKRAKKAGQAAALHKQVTAGRDGQRESHASSFLGKVENARELRKMSGGVGKSSNFAFKRDFKTHPKAKGKVTAVNSRGDWEKMRTAALASPVRAGTPFTPKAVKPLKPEVREARAARKEFLKSGRDQAKATKQILSSSETHKGQVAHGKAWFAAGGKAGLDAQTAPAKKKRLSAAEKRAKKAGQDGMSVLRTHANEQLLRAPRDASGKPLTKAAALHKQVTAGRDGQRESHASSFLGKGENARLLRKQSGGRKDANAGTISPRTGSQAGVKIATGKIKLTSQGKGAAGPQAHYSKKLGPSLKTLNKASIKGPKVVKARALTETKQFGNIGTRVKMLHAARSAGRVRSPAHGSRLVNNLRHGMHGSVPKAPKAGFQLGKKGGKFFVSSNGKKVYLKRH